MIQIKRIQAGGGAFVALLAAMLGLSGCATNRAAERELDARKAQSRLDLGIDHLGNGRTALALREFLTAETLDPQNPKIQYALGEAYLAKGRSEEAEAHLREALRIHPGFHDARLSLSALLIVQDRYEEALAESRVLLDDPTFSAPWRALSNVGWIELQLGRNAEARRSLEEALDFDSHYSQALFVLAMLEAQEGHRLEALQLYRRILELEPGPPAEAEANYRIAEIYVSLGKRRHAIGHLKAAIARAPEDQWGKRSEEYLLLLR